MRAQSGASARRGARALVTHHAQRQHAARERFERRRHELGRNTLPRRRDQRIADAGGVEQFLVSPGLRGLRGLLLGFLGALLLVVIALPFVRREQAGRTHGGSKIVIGPTREAETCHAPVFDLHVLAASFSFLVLFLAGVRRRLRAAAREELAVHPGHRDQSPNTVEQVH